MHLTLGIDPGFDRMGWGVISSEGSRDTMVAYGCITTPKSASMPARLESLSRELDALLLAHRPHRAGIEKLFFAQNRTTALPVGQARGIILLALQKNGIPIIEVTPSQVKTAACGWGRADKRQVQAMVAALLSLSAVPRPDDAADALAIALCASRHALVI